MDQEQLDDDMGMNGNLTTGFSRFAVHSKEEKVHAKTIRFTPSVMRYIKDNSEKLGISINEFVFRIVEESIEKEKQLVRHAASLHRTQANTNKATVTERNHTELENDKNTKKPKLKAKRGGATK